MKKALTIAGSDSGGGAGVQADLKTFISRGVYGMSVVTALTSQNTMGVQGIYEIEANFVGKQIDSIMTDIGADIWKIGMLANKQVIKIVSEKVKEYNIGNLVVDPVMIAKSGDHLLHTEAQNILISDLIPMAYVITPNIYEAEALTQINIKKVKDMETSAKKIYNMGAKNVIVKGGHSLSDNYAIDLLFNGNDFYVYQSDRIDTNNTHGSGCTFASAIAAEIAKGVKVEKAVHKAKAYLTKLIQNAQNLNIGHGHGPLNHFLSSELEINMNLVKVNKE